MRVLYAATGEKINDGIADILEEFIWEEVSCARSFSELEEELTEDGYDYDLLILSADYLSSDEVSSDEESRLDIVEDFCRRGGYLLLAFGEDGPGDIDELRYFLDSVDADDFQLNPANREELMARIELARRQIARNTSIAGVSDHRKAREDFMKAAEREWKRSYRSSEPLSLIMLELEAEVEESQKRSWLKDIGVTIEEAVFRPGDRAAVLEAGLFAVLLPETDLSGGRTVLKRLKRLVEINCREHEYIEEFSLNLGMAGAVPSMRDEFSKLIEVAEEALVKARDNPDEDVKVISGSELESNLRLE